MFNDNVVSGSGGGNFVGCDYEYAIFVRAAAHLKYTIFGDSFLSRTIISFYF